jgi:hypothetical protein
MNRMSSEQRRDKDRIEWLQVQLAAQQRQLDNTSPSAATIANIKEQMTEDRDEIARLKRS